MFTISSCKDEIVRDPSPIANPNSTNVYFSVKNSTSPVLALKQDTFKVMVIRKIKTTVQEVAITSENVYGDKFSIPDKVVFPAGKDSVLINIVVKNLELMKKYKLALQIDPEQTNPYVIQKVYPRLEFNLTKEDYASYAEGTYTSDFFGGDWPQTLEYSPSTKLYRFKDLWATGYNVTFKWDEAAAPGVVNIQGTSTSAKDYIYLQTGSVDPTYGMVTANYPTANLKYYNSTTKTFTFPIKWTVSAGSFGIDADIYVITKTY